MGQNDSIVVNGQTAENKLGGKSHKQRSAILALMLVLVLVLVAGVVYDKKYRKQAAPQTVNSISQEQFQKIQQTAAYSGNLVAVDKGKKVLTIQTSDGTKELAFNSDTEVNVGIAAEPSSLDSIAVGTPLSVTYDTANKVATYVWYE